MSTPMNSLGLADIPDYPTALHPAEWVRYARELFVLSDVLNGDDPSQHELWLRVDHALLQLEERLTTPGSQRGKRFMLKGPSVRAIEALAEHFACTRQAVIRQLLRQCPVERFPVDWVVEDTRVKGEPVETQEESRWTMPSGGSPTSPIIAACGNAPS